MTPPGHSLTPKYFELASFLYLRLLLVKSNGNTGPVASAIGSLGARNLRSERANVECFSNNLGSRGPWLAPNGTYLIAPPSLREGREESSGEGQSECNSATALTGGRVCC